MNGFKWTMIANYIMWIASAVAILGATYITKNANCLWALFIPAMSGFTYKSTDDKTK